MELHNHAVNIIIESVMWYHCMHNAMYIAPMMPKQLFAVALVGSPFLEFRVSVQISWLEHTVQITGPNT